MACRFSFPTCESCCSVSLLFLKNIFQRTSQFFLKLRHLLQLYCPDQQLKIRLIELQRLVDRQRTFDYPSTWRRENCHFFHGFPAQKQFSQCLSIQPMSILSKENKLKNSESFLSICAIAFFNRKLYEDRFMKNCFNYAVSTTYFISSPYSRDSFLLSTND